MQKKLCFKVVIAYNGASFAGWQEQKCNNSVTSVLKSRFSALFKEEVSIIGASRTDAGVHARCQVAKICFKDFGLEAARLFDLWNKALPQDLIIKSFMPAGEAFHPQKNCLLKIYTYTLFYKKPDPLIAQFGYFLPMFEVSNFDLFEAALALFQGSHDFFQFFKSEDGAPKKTKRNIRFVNVVYDKNLFAYKITFAGKGFLRYQIRRMIGAAVEVALRKNDSALQAIRISLAGQKSDVPTRCINAQGLCLERIVYK